MRQQTILVFDVNETLLDVGALRPHFERLFGDAAVLKQWFLQMLLYSQTVTQTGQYADFGVLAKAVLQMLGTSHGKDVPEQAAAAVLHAMRSLPAHPEVAEALDRLHQAGFRMVALTNSAGPAANEQLQSAELAGKFERIFSVDAVQAYKPAAAAYRYVAAELGVEPGELTMIAAHPWDLLGARAAGCRVAFIERPGSAWLPLFERPEKVTDGLAALADLLLADQRSSPANL